MDYDNITVENNPWFLSSGLDSPNVKKISLGNLLWGALNSRTNNVVRGNLYRGASLGTAVTDEQWEEIRKGTFRNMFIGDYWSIGGYTWQIVDFNYWLEVGDTVGDIDYRCTTPHVVIMPTAALDPDICMNDDGTSTGGYINTDMHKTKLNDSKAIIRSAFGANHILTVDRQFSNAVTNYNGRNVVTGVIHDQCDIELPSLAMMLGVSDLTVREKYSSDIEQLALMKLYSRRTFQKYVSCWTCDVAYSGRFFATSGRGNGYEAYDPNARYVGVRPVFAIKG